MTAFIDGDFLEHGAVAIGILFYGFIFALVIIVLVRLAKFLGRANKEQQLTRLELGKVADEVQKMRRQIQDVSEKLPPAKEKQN